MTPHHERPGTGPTAARAAAMQALVPVIETRRLTLRAPRIEDFPVYFDIAGAPRSKGMGGPMSRGEAWADFVQVVATWYLRGHGGWTIEDRATAEILGFVIIGFEPGDREPELGYMLTAAAEGRGIATEAARAARDHGFGPFGLASMVSYVADDNVRSIRVAERLGAVLDVPADWDHADTLVYRHRAPDRGAA